MEPLMCEACEKTSRNGWIASGPGVLNEKRHFICRKCASTEREVDDILWKSFMKRPNAPAPPPPPLPKKTKEYVITLKEA